MTDKQDAIVDMYQEVTRFFEKYKDFIKDDTVLITHNGELVVIVKDIAKYNAAQEFDSRGFAEKKKKAKTALASDIFKLSSAFGSFAIDTDNQPMLKEFDLSISVVMRLKDAEFMNYSNQLSISLDQYKDELKPYHITAEDLVNLTNNTQAYSDLLHMPEEVIKDKSVATDKIKELITKGHNLIDDSIDRDMVHYKESQKDFYDEYIKRREIYDAQTTHLSLKGTIHDADSDCDGTCVLAHVKCKVKFKPGKAWKEMDCVSTEKGNYQFKGIPDGKCTVTFELDLYDKVEKVISVYSDKSTTLDIEMKKTI